MPRPMMVCTPDKPGRRGKEEGQGKGSWGGDKENRRNIDYPIDNFYLFRYVMCGTSTLAGISSPRDVTQWAHRAHLYMYASLFPLYNLYFFL